MEAFDILSALFPNRRVVVGDQPPNWKDQGNEAMDLGVKAKKAWSMVGEVKYFRGVGDVASGRENVLQDAARLASADVSSGSPRILVVCQHSHGKDDLWKKGSGRTGKVQRAASALLPKTVNTPINTTVGVIGGIISSWQLRTPSSAQLANANAIRVTLLNKTPFRQKSQNGLIRIWNIERP